MLAAPIDRTLFHPGDPGPSSGIIYMCSRPNSKRSPASRAPFPCIATPRSCSASWRASLRQAVNFDFVAVFLYDEASHKIRNPVLETVNGPGFAIPDDFPAEETITWWVWQHQAPVVIPSRDEETRFPLMMEVFRATTACSPPACFRSPPRTAASAVSVSACSSPNGYSEEDVRYLSLVADQVALAVDNRLARRRAAAVEEELRKQKAHFEKLFELAPEAIVLRDIDNRVLRDESGVYQTVRLQPRRIARAGISAT